MTINTELITVGLIAIGLFFTIQTSIVGAAVYVVYRFGKLDKNKVDHKVCSEHRQHCPCVQDIRDIKEQINKVDSP